MKLIDAQILMNQKMREHGLIEKGWKFAFNNRLKRVLGRCWDSKRLLELSTAYVQANDEKLVLDTILHEIAHALSPGDGHGKVWHATCVRIGAVPKAAWKTKENCGLVSVKEKHKWRLAIKWDGSLELTDYTRARRGNLSGSHLSGRPDTKGRLVWIENI